MVDDSEERVDESVDEVIDFTRGPADLAAVVLRLRGGPLLIKRACQNNNIEGTWRTQKPRSITNGNCEAGAQHRLSALVTVVNDRARNPFTNCLPAVLC